MATDWMNRWAAAEAVLSGVSDPAALEDLPKLATEAMVAGWDSDSLRLLAGESASANFFDLRDLFAEAARELGRPELDRRSALRRVLEFEARRIVDGELDPIAGAQHIRNLLLTLALEQDDDVGQQIVHFDFLHDEVIGGWGRLRPEIESEILGEARKIVESAPE